MHPTVQEVLFLLGRSHLRCKEVPIDALIYEAVVSILGRRTTAHIDRDLGAEDRGLGKRKLGCSYNHVTKHSPTEKNEGQIYNDDRRDHQRSGRIIRDYSPPAEFYDTLVLFLLIFLSSSSCYRLTPLPAPRLCGFAGSEQNG